MEIPVCRSGVNEKARRPDSRAGNEFCCTHAQARLSNAPKLLRKPRIGWSDLARSSTGPTPGTGPPSAKVEPKTEALARMAVSIAISVVRSVESAAVSAVIAATIGGVVVAAPAAAWRLRWRKPLSGASIPSARPFYRPVHQTRHSARRVSKPGRMKPGNTMRPAANLGYEALRVRIIRGGKLAKPEINDKLPACSV